MRREACSRLPVEQADSPARTQASQNVVLSVGDQSELTAAK